MCRLCSLQSAPALLQTVSSFTFQQHNVFMCYSSWFHTHLLAQVRSTNQLPSREPTQSFVEIWEVCMSAPLQASVIYPHTITPFPARSAETFRCIFAGVSFQASSLQTTGMSTCFFNASEKKRPIKRLRILHEVYHPLVLSTWNPEEERQFWCFYGCQHSNLTTSFIILLL